MPVTQNLCTYFKKALQANLTVNTLRYCGETACVEEKLRTIGNPDITTLRSVTAGGSRIQHRSIYFAHILLTRSRTETDFNFKYQNRIIRIVPHPSRKRGVPPLQLVAGSPVLDSAARQCNTPTIEIVHY